MKKLTVTMFAAIVLIIGMFTLSTLAETIDYQDPADGFNDPIVPEDVNQPNPNANQTGQGSTFEELIKTIGMLDNVGAGNVSFDHSDRTDQKIHGSYQNNTNSCASCHQTHVATAEKILFADASATCAACHDGTLGFYDVFATGKAYFNSSSTAGTFGGDVERNSSVHSVGGNVLVKAAPGGNPDGEGSNSWGGTFTCASCHAPHGSYSDRLLHYNPNNMANTPRSEGGNKLMGVPIVAGPNPGADSDYFLYVSNGVMTLRTGSGTGEVVDTPWLNSGFAFRNNEGENLTTRPGGRYGLQNFSVDHRNATVRDGHLDVAQLVGGTADIPIVYIVSLPRDESYVSEVSNLDWKHDVTATLSSSSTQQLSTFCGTCHQDYLKGSTSQQATSQWNEDHQFFGHTTNAANQRSCISCHFAHGNDVDIIVDASGRTVFDLVEDKGWTLDQARNYMEDKNSSSALKKWTNMAGCFACHNSSRNTWFVNQFPTDEQPSGYIADPSTKRYE